MTRLPSSRSNLVKMRRRLIRVERGIELLRRKREVLVGELFRQARPAVASREAAEEQADRAHESLLFALSGHGQRGLRALGWPLGESEVSIETAEVWGLSFTSFAEPPRIRRRLEARNLAPGSVGPAAIECAEDFETFLELLLQTAAIELQLRKLGQVLGHTTRQLNMLEQRVAPGLRHQLAGMRSTLEEREREERVSLQRLRRSRRTLRGSAQ